MGSAVQHEDVPMRFFSSSCLAALLLSAALPAQNLTGSAHVSPSGGIRFDTTVSAIPGSLASLWVGFAPDLTPTITPWGDVFLDPTQPLMAFPVALDSSGRGTVPLQVPIQITELQLTAQALVFDPAGGPAITNLVGFGCFQPPIAFPPAPPVAVADWNGTSKRLVIAYAGLPAGSQIRVSKGTIMGEGSVLFSTTGRTVESVQGNGHWVHDAGIGPNEVIEVRVIDGLTGQTYRLGTFRCG